MHLQLKRAESFIENKEYLIVFCMDNVQLLCVAATYIKGEFDCDTYKKKLKDIIDAYELPMTPDEYCHLIIEPDDFV